MAQSDSEILMSIVVIGKNEGERLTNCLRSVSLMDPLPGLTELIYVDSGSTDDSIARAQMWKAEVIPLSARGASAAVARNAGLKRAKGKYVLFLDGDMELMPTFCCEALKVFENPHIAVVCGHLREKDPSQSVYEQILDLNWISPPGVVLACGGNAMMNRHAVEQVGGYDPTLTAGEEPELCRRLRAKGYLIYRLDALMTYHTLGITTFRQYVERAFRTGYTYANVSGRFKATSDPMWRYESIHNLLKGSILVFGIPLCLAIYFIFNTIFPLLFFLAAFVVMALRTAMRIHRHSSSLSLSLLYGLHAHLQHIPIFFGQLAYLRDKARERYSAAMGYKGDL